jgi:hypothetical protein
MSLLLALLDKGTFENSFLVDSRIITLTISTEARRINFTAIAWGFLYFALLCATF